MLEERGDVNPFAERSEHRGGGAAGLIVLGAKQLESRRLKLLEKRVGEGLGDAAEDAGEGGEIRGHENGLRRAERGVQLGGERLDARGERNELREGGGATRAHELGRVGESLDEGGLQLWHERLEHRSALGDEQRERVQDRSLDG